MNKFFYLLSTFVLLSPSLVWGRGQEFIPRLLGYSGDLTVQSHYTSELTKTVAGKSSLQKRHETMDSRETVNVGAVGYVYHPDLFLFSMAGSGAFEQLKDRTHNNDVSNEDNADSTLGDYLFEGAILRRKPYHAKISFSNERPFQSGSPGYDYVQNKKAGLELFYQKRPYNARLAYNYLNYLTRQFANVDEGLAVERDSSDKSDTYDASLNYNKEKFSSLIAGRYYTLQNKSSITTLDEPNTVEEGDPRKQIKKKINSYAAWFNDIYDLRTDSSWSWDSSEQGTSSEITENYTVSGDADIVLPWNFSLKNYLYKNHYNTKNQSGSNRQNRTQNIDQLKLDLTQELFESLESHVTGEYSSNSSNIQSISSTGATSSTPGNYTTTSYGLRSLYHKKLRGGGLRGSIGDTISMVQQQGPVSIGPEVTGLLQKGDIYELARGDADPSTIKVEIEFPANSGRWHYLLKGSNYEISSVQVRIKIIDVDSVTGGANDTNPYVFRLNYSTVPADYTIKYDYRTLTAGFDFFDNTVKGDWSHTYTVQEIVKGDPDSTELDHPLTEDKFSLAYDVEYFSFAANYRVLEVDYSEKEFDYNAQYKKRIKLIPKVQTSLKFSYSKSNLQYSSADGSSNSDEYIFSSRANNSFKIPLLKTAASQYMSFRRQRGSVSRTSLNSFGGTNTRSTAVDSSESDAWLTGIGFGVRIPFTKVNLRFGGSYEFEDFVNGTKTTTIDYRVNSSYAWRFGATSIKLNGSYDVNNTDSHKGAFASETRDDEFQLYLTMTRKLF